MAFVKGKTKAIVLFAPRFRARAYDFSRMVAAASAGALLR